MTVSVGVDGFNLALPAGTGVASYARNVCDTVRSLGHRLDLVYGVPLPDGLAAEARETSFYSRLVEETKPAPPSFRRTVRRSWISPFARTLVEVPRHGRVIAPELAERAPPSDRLFTRGGIFQICERYFRRYGRFMPLRLPDPPAVMHWTYPLPIVLEGAANLYTIHDLVPLRLPHTSLEDKAYHERMLRACVGHAARICTVSETSRRDIIELLGAEPDQVVDASQAIDPGHDDLSDEALGAWIERLFGLSAGGYFLFFGAIEPKKNVGRLIEAYLEAGLSTPLVIVGKRGWQWDGELRLLTAGQVEGTARIRQIDYLPRPMLMRLVRGARAVAFPSLYEGFGLPAAEAMAQGTPVLASTGGALPEVVGDAGLLVDPYDVGAIAAAMTRLDRDEGLRAALAAAGRARVTRYAPSVHARALDTLYRTVAATAAGR